jgi:hypothetical protein
MAGQAVAVDSDVLYARTLLEGAAGVIKRFNVHRLVLGVVTERYVPMTLAIGPNADNSEAQEQVDAMCALLRAMAAGVRITVFEVRTKPALCGVLQVKETGIGRCVNRSLHRGLASRDRRIVLATAAALAAAKMPRPEQPAVGP